MVPNPFVPDAAGGYDGSTFSAHLQASGYTDWGSKFAFNFLHDELPPNNWPAPYDASKYCGVAFWGKRSAGSWSSFWLLISDIHTHPGGGLCSTDADAGAGGAGNQLACYDHHSKSVTLTTEWAYYEVFFDEMQQGNWGYQAEGGLATDQVYALQLSFEANQTHEVWFDDFAFVVRDDEGACP